MYWRGITSEPVQSVAGRHPQARPLVFGSGAFFMRRLRVAAYGQSQVASGKQERCDYRR